MASSSMGACVSTDPAASDTPTAADLAVLDDRAEEVGLAMARSDGPEPEAFARRLDGFDVDVLVLSGSSYDEAGAEVVLRVQLDEVHRVSACYRWVFQLADAYAFSPERLDECPDVPVIELGPPPVEPRLPVDLHDRLVDGLAPPAESEAAVLARVRAIYTEAVEAELQQPDVEPEHLLGIDDALDEGSLASYGEAVVVAIGRRFECKLVKVAPDRVWVWTPDRVSLQPGELGCDPVQAAE